MLGKQVRQIRSFYVVRHRTFASGRSRVKIIGSDEAYAALTSEKAGQKTIAYFTAKWCPPCKFISPIYDTLSTEHEDIEFAKIDVDELSDTTSKAGVTSMPTFLYFNKGQLLPLLSFAGADEALLRDNIKKLSDM